MDITLIIAVVIFTVISIFTVIVVRSIMITIIAFDVLYSFNYGVYPFSIADYGRGVSLNSPSTPHTDG